MINTNFLRQHAPRWIILLFDILTSAVSITGAYYLRFNFQIPSSALEQFIMVVPFFVSIRLITFLVFRMYAGIVRYTSTKDTVRIFLIITLGSVILLVASFISRIFYGFYLFPFSILLIDFLIHVFITTFSRLSVKAIFYQLINFAKSKTKVVIFGSDDFALSAKKALERAEDIHYTVAAFIDDANQGKKLDSVLIHSLDRLPQLIQTFEISELIIAKRDLSLEVKNELIELCLNNYLKILTVPKLNDWINGELSFKQMRNIRIEDLLERDPIVLDEGKIASEIQDKSILVTGGAGSIGSEIVRQLTRFKPKLIVILDQAESPLYDLELELREKLMFYNFEIVIGDLTNVNRLAKVFQTYKPDVVYHAAAYKHVPMMENNPAEAIHNNIFGSKMVADFSVKYGAKKFVMISTDKAVNPTNIMGASKRIAEIYIQAINRHSNTRFITTRFGNVLGSNGSVIPRFKAQIENGGPITVTHPDVTRYFMTIPEACSLVLEAGAFGNGGEIFIFDMGKSVKIVDLAKKMIKLYGLKLGRDITIKFTGLRPGEKLYEELLADKENTMPTHHSQIMIAKVRENDVDEVTNKIDALIEIYKNQDNFEIVTKMKEIVPEFKSQNSIYEKLDTPAESVQS